MLGVLLSSGQRRHDLEAALWSHQGRCLRLCPHVWCAILQGIRVLANLQSFCLLLAAFYANKNEAAMLDAL